MIRRTFLRRLVWAAAGLAAGTALADPVDDIIGEIRSQGFTIVRVQRTWLGRVRIIGQDANFRREVVIDPTTGEIRRDLLIPRKAPAGKPELGTSRDVGTIGEEPAANGEEPAPSEDGDDANWGGGWGSPDAPEEGSGEGEDGADER